VVPSSYFICCSKPGYKCAFSLAAFAGYLRGPVDREVLQGKLGIIPSLDKDPNNYEKEDFSSSHDYERHATSAEK